VLLPSAVCFRLAVIVLVDWMQVVINIAVVPVPLPLPWLAASFRYKYLLAVYFAIADLWYLVENVSSSISATPVGNTLSIVQHSKANWYHKYGHVLFLPASLLLSMQHICNEFILITPIRAALPPPQNPFQYENDINLAEMQNRLHFATFAQGLGICNEHEA